MRCNDARELLGVADEASAQQQLDLHTHIAACSACAMAAADEAAFRAAMASRATLPVRPSPRAAMMQTPPPGLHRLVWRRRLRRGVPITAATVAMVLGTAYLQLRVPATSQDTALQAGAVAPSEGAGVVLAATPVRRMLAPVPPAATVPRPKDIAVDLPPEPTLAPAVVIVVPGQYPVIAAPAPAEPVAPDPVGPDPITDDPDEDDSGSAGVPTPPAPVVALTSLTVQAVTDLAGGRDDCPGCDGITPPDMGAARSNPVEAVRVRLEAVDASGTLTYLGSLTLEPTDAGTAAATADVPIAASYVVSFEGADGGFVLCTGAEPRVTISPTEGGLFATFRLWRGCPVP